MEDFLPLGRIQAKHTHELGELTHQTGNTLHTEGNLVNTSHPGCERNMAVEAEKSDPGHGDLDDYCSVVTFLLKGDGFATTWRMYKCLMPPVTHPKVDSPPFKIGRKWNFKIDLQTTTHLKTCRRKKEGKQNKRFAARDIQFELLFKYKLYFLLSIAYYLYDFLYWLVARRAPQPLLLSN